MKRDLGVAVVVPVCAFGERLHIRYCYPRPISGGGFHNKLMSAASLA